MTMESPQWETNVEQIALNNPIILTQILQQTGTPLKTCRLISHFWNDMVLSLPSTRLALNLTSKNPVAEENFDSDDDDDVVIDPGPFLALFLTLDERLARRICATCSSSSDSTINLFASRLLHVCDKFNERVQILDVSVHSEECLPSIYHILKDCCPNLAQLRIKVEPGTTSPRYNLPEVLFHPLHPKPNLTTFAINAKLNVEIQCLIQLIINAAPNLKRVTIPLGFCPDFAPSNHLESLTIGQDDFHLPETADMSNLLAQVGDQLITLRLGNGIMTLIDKPLGFELPGRKLPKLKTFQNLMVDVFRCDDLFKNIARGMPSLTRMELGEAFEGSKSVDEILQDLRNSGQIVANVTNLVLIGVYDVALLDGLGAVFPNVAELKVDSLYEGKNVSYNWVGVARGPPWGRRETELGAVLAACKEWGGLKRLKLGVSMYPRNVEGVIRDLLDNRDLYRGRLKTLEISLMRCMYYPSYDLTPDEMNLFENLLMEMHEMDEVTISFLYFGEESRRQILDFMASNEMEMAKFKMFQGGKTCRGGD